MVRRIDTDGICVLPDSTAVVSALEELVTRTAQKNENGEITIVAVLWPSTRRIVPTLANSTTQI